jgi:hypothetical protein
MVERSFTKIIPLLIFLFTAGTLISEVYAQSEERSDEYAAIKHISKIKKGHIIFILPSHLNKLNALHRMAHDPKDSESSRKKSLKKYEELIEERDEMHSEIRVALDSFWTFCPYYFIYDFQLRSSPPEKNFAKVQPLPSRDLPGEGYRVRMGRTESTAHFGVEAMVVTDPNGNDLKRPFPFYVKLNKRTWLNGLISIFLPSTYSRKEMSKLIRKLQARFERFYEDNRY